MKTIPFQYELSPELPNVYGPIDYRKFRTTLIKIDEILVKSGFEREIICEAIEQFVSQKKLNPIKFYNSKKAGFHYKLFRRALRCNIARHLSGESYRLFSIRLADSNLFQWFVGVGEFSSAKGISKSALERYEKYFAEEMVANKIRTWLASLKNADAAQILGLHQPIDFTNVFSDSTCIKAHIHFPVDWVLLKDAARTILLSVKTIRAKGLKHRMIEPALLLKQMNKLSIGMTHARKRFDSKKQRKTIFRAMKKLSHCIAKHGLRYRELLLNEWQKTDWTWPQVQQVIKRIDNVLQKLPAAIKQAHDRIISEKLIPSDKKILSLYDDDAHVIVRGKAGNEVEFGQGLVLTEQKDGLIIDWKFFTEMPPHDSKLFAARLNKIEKYYGPINAACADRGFSSKSNTDLLQTKNIYNALCPKSPVELQEKLSDPIFLKLQTRRSQTEARIGIFKNVFLGKPLRSRITASKRTAINWCVLTHNLWVLARKAIDDELTLLKKAA